MAVLQFIAGFIMGIYLMEILSDRMVSRNLMHLLQTKLSWGAGRANGKNRLKNPTG